MCLFLNVYVLHHGRYGLVLFSPQHRVTFDRAGSYAVTGLKPDTLYMFSLAARSEMGLGVFTTGIECRTTQSSKLYSFLLSLSLRVVQLFYSREHKIITECLQGV